MDFFASQDRARASTRRLIVLYALAVLGVVISLNVVAAIVTGSARQGTHERGTVESAQRVNWIDAAFDPRVYVVTTASVLAIIGLATLIKQAQIGGDGAKVAELLGGKPVVPGTDDLDERKLINIVEEMSLASGVPVPRVFILDNEDGINAFASGIRTEAAVIGVTRGAIRSLNRDELQGVIAHEFSHILNGDMRLNLRLIALNFGIMAIGYIGFQVLRFMPGSGRSSSSKKDSGNATIAILAVAVAMIVIGYVGTFFGKLLQAAVSRQREYLADASAVQFTRNPGGISNALKKIGGLHVDDRNGSELASPNAGEVSHMFFADGVTGFLDSLFATHPPLKDRIRAIDPTFSSDFASLAAPSLASLSPAASGFAGASIPPPLPRARQTIAAQPSDLRAARAVANPRELSFAAVTLDALTDELLAAARDPYEARALAIALLLDADETLHQSQLRMVAGVDEVMASRAAQFHRAVAAAGPAARLPLLDLALPALHQLSRSQRAQFRQLCEACASADGQLSPFELAVSCVLEAQLPTVPQMSKPAPKYRSVNAVRESAAVVLSSLANVGGEEQADRAYQLGASSLGLDTIPPRPVDYDASALRAALAALCESTPVVQQRMVEAAANCVAADRVVRIEEIELMRALCAAFSVPIPPFLVSA
jgi:Zn-dependent protease with chaperone function